MADDPVCVVPARGTEPGLPKKNFKRVGGKPLVAHTVGTALDCDAFEDVFVSTESEALAELAREHGATVPFLRPEELAAPDVLLHEVVEHAVERLDAGGYADVGPGTPVVVLQPNVPFRRARDVTAALETFRAGHDAVVSVVEDRGFYWRGDGETLAPRFAERTVRAELEPLYRETGSINVTTPRLLAEGTRVGDAPGYVVTDRLSSLSVDSVLDLWMAERLADGPRVVFRVDGGGEVGMGHVSRCLTLAAELEASLRCSVAFVSDAAYPAGIERIREAGHEVHAVESAPLETVAALDPDLVFLDVLDTDAARVRDLHATAAAVLTLEDAGGGLVHADFVVNALYEDAGEDRNHLSGADYVVLREEFDGREPRVPTTAERVLLTFGGSDPAGLSVLAARAAVEDTARQYRLVVGPDADARAELDRIAGDAPNVEILDGTEAMGEQMAWADVAVSAGGRTMYELAATGTPTLAIAQNDRERDRLETLDEQGVVAYLGDAGSVSPADLRQAVEDLAADRDRRQSLSERGQSFVDGAGTRRILDLVHDLLAS